MIFAGAFMFAVLDDQRTAVERSVATKEPSLLQLVSKSAVKTTLFVYRLPLTWFPIPSLHHWKNSLIYYPLPSSP